MTVISSTVETLKEGRQCESMSGPWGLLSNMCDHKLSGTTAFSLVGAGQVLLLVISAHTKQSSPSRQHPCCKIVAAKCSAAENAMSRPPSLSECDGFACEEACQMSEPKESRPGSRTP